MVGGVSAVVKDLIPYGLATNDRAHLEGLNLVGMKRRGFNNKDSLEASKVISEIFMKHSGKVFNKKIKEAAEKYKDNPVIQSIIQFLQEDESLGFCGYK